MNEHIESLIMMNGVNSIIGHSISRLGNETRYFVDIWNCRNIKERYYIRKDEIGHFEGIIKKANECKKKKRDERNRRDERRKLNEGMVDGVVESVMDTEKVEDVIDTVKGDLDIIDYDEMIKIDTVKGDLDIIDYDEIGNKKDTGVKDDLDIIDYDEID